MLEGSYTFSTDADPVEEVGPGTFVFIPPGAVHGFRTGRQGGKLICFWPSTVEAAFFNDRMSICLARAGICRRAMTAREPRDGRSTIL